MKDLTSFGTSPDPLPKTVGRSFFRSRESDGRCPPRPCKRSCIAENRCPPVFKKDRCPCFAAQLSGEILDGRIDSVTTRLSVCCPVPALRLNGVEPAYDDDDDDVIVVVVVLVVSGVSLRLSWRLLPTTTTPEVFCDDVVVVTKPKVELFPLPVVELDNPLEGFDLRCCSSVFGIQTLIPSHLGAAGDGRVPVLCSWNGGGVLCRTTRRGLGEKDVEETRSTTEVEKARSRLLLRLASPPSTIGEQPPSTSP